MQAPRWSAQLRNASCWVVQRCKMHSVRKRQSEHDILFHTVRVCTDAICKVTLLQSGLTHRECDMTCTQTELEGCTQREVPLRFDSSWESAVGHETLGPRGDRKSNFKSHSNQKCVLVNVSSYLSFAVKKFVCANWKSELKMWSCQRDS